MLQACVLSCDDEYASFLKITLKQKLKSVDIWNSENPPASLRYIVDLDSYSYPIPDGEVVLLTSKKSEKPYESDCLWLNRPFRPNRLLAILGLWDDDVDFVELPSKHSVLLGDEEISLSKKEFELLHLLLSANGEYVSEEEIQKQIFPDSKKAGVVRVYIHYLRDKIEKDHTKRIFRKSGLGYAIGRGESKC